MKSLLIVSTLLVLANCHESLDGIIDTFLKVNDVKYMNKSQIYNVITVDEDMFQFRFTLYGLSHVTRASEATVTTGANGPVVAWRQEEAVRNFTGTIYTIYSPAGKPLEKHQVSGHIAMNPVNVRVQYTKQGSSRFWPEVGLIEPLAIKSWSLDQPELRARFQDAITPKMEDYITGMRFNNLLWADIKSTPLFAPVGFPWPDMKRYLQSVDE
ncbi:hypothetical protein HDE_09802 [Halotydeus destructor]|nr:hypothetical protein HDE_09802 [Halotydeus destructor]